MKYVGSSHDREDAIQLRKKALLEEFNLII
jgi:hypothetical protein